MLKHSREAAEVALSFDGHMSFEWPRHNSGWLLPELVAFIAQHGLTEGLVDGCACGMTNAKGKPILKRWRFVCSSPRLATTLGAIRCQHKPSFKHGELTGGADTAKSAYYTDSLCRSILAGYFGSHINTQAMVCERVGPIPRGRGHHREAFVCENE